MRISQSKLELFNDEAHALGIQHNRPFYMGEMQYLSKIAFKLLASAVEKYCEQLTALSDELTDMEHAFEYVCQTGKQSRPLFDVLAFVGKANWPEGER